MEVEKEKHKFDKEEREKKQETEEEGEELGGKRRIDGEDKAGRGGEEE